MNVRVYSQQDYHTAHERLASYRIADLLRSFAANNEDVWLFQNVQFGAIDEQRRDGSVGRLNPCEPDLIVVKRTAIIVVEMKHWQGKIEWPTTSERMKEAWHRIEGGVKTKICDGFQSPLSQLWYNRRVLVSHLRALAQNLPTEAARTSAFELLSSALLFTDDSIEFACSKPDFWRSTSVCTLTDTTQSTPFASTVASATTRRRDHKTDQRHEIELSDEDIEFLINLWGLNEVSGTTEVESQTVGRLEQHIRTSVEHMKPYKKKLVSDTLPLPEMEGKALPIRLVSFYIDILERNAKSQPDITITPEQYRKFYQFLNINLESLLSDSGILVRASNLPDWQPTEELSVGVYLLGEIAAGNLAAKPLFTLPAEISLADNQGDVPMRRVRVTDNTRCELNLAALRRVPAFRHDEDDEIISYLSDVGELPNAFEQITTVLRRIHGDVQNFNLGPLPAHASDASLCGVLFKPSQAFTRHLIDDLNQIRTNWEDSLLKGKDPDDLAWRFLCHPSPAREPGSWKPRQASILPLNYEQSLAASMVYDDSVTIGVVSGPPGTGKSALICNVLAEAHEQNKTILFASYNNGAVDVVTKKVNEEILKLPLIVGLGSASRTKETVEALQRAAAAPTITAQQLSQEVRQARSEILQINGKLRDLKDEYQAFLEQSAEEVRLHMLVEEAFGEFPQGAILYDHDLEQLSDFNKQLDNWANAIASHQMVSGHAESIFRRIKATSKGWVGAAAVFSKKRFHSDADLYYTLLVKDTVLYSCLRIIEPFLHNIDRVRIHSHLFKIATLLICLKQVQSDLEGKSEADYLVRWERLERARIVPSRSLLTARARHNVSTYGGAWSYSLNVRGHLPASTINGMRVVSTTSLSVRRKVSLDARFDILIVDEASQSTISSVLPLLYRAKRAIVIGDERQLQPVVTTEDHVYFARLRAYRLINDAAAPWIERDASILTLAQHHLRGSSDSYVMLRDHYRCHPHIIGFSNTEFYDGLLRIPTEMPKWERETGIRWIDSRGEETNKVNQTEIDLAVAEIRRLFESGLSHEQIGIVTPYRAQKDALLTRLKKDNLRDGESGSIDVDTAHGFQGREKDVMLYSLVVTGKSPIGRRQWSSSSVSSAHLINVAVTRARKLLLVIGDPSGVMGYTAKLKNWCDAWTSRFDRTS